MLVADARKVVVLRLACCLPVCGVRSEHLESRRVVVFGESFDERTFERTFEKLSSVAFRCLGAERTFEKLSSVAFRWPEGCR